ncbi:MAG: isopentenyl phosphate kinase [Archaeoglobaceae archaeon]
MKTELKILKIGGSVITDKSRGFFEKPREEEMTRIAEEIGANPENLIVIHGAGSFGHPYVEKFGRNMTASASILTHMACRRLNTLFCNALFESGVKVLPINPFSALRVDEDLEIDEDFIVALIEEGIVPVLHGDMVYNRSKKVFEVLSGDRITFELARKLNVNRIGFATDAPGVIVDGEVQEELIIEQDLLEFVEETEEAETKSDVTGGMKGKLKSLLELPPHSEVLIFSGLEEGNILRFLNNEKVGTKIRKQRD